MSWEEINQLVNEKADFMWYLSEIKSEKCNTYGLKTK